MMWEYFIFGVTVLWYLCFIKLYAAAADIATVNKWYK